MTLTKRGNTYHLDTSLGERRVRCSLGVRDPKAAERLANRVQFALSDGPKSPVWSELRVALPSSSFKRLTNGVLPDGPVDLPTLEQKFYEHVERRRQLGQIGEGAKQNYDRVTKVFFDRALEAGLKTVVDLTSEFVESHLLWRKESIQAKGGSGRGLVTDVVVLSALFDFAVEEGWIPKTPLKYKPKIPPVEQAVQPFTEEEMAALEAVQKSPTENLIFSIFRGTGLRCADVGNLMWSNIDWKTRTLRILTAKRLKRVEIPLSKDLYKVLEDEHIPGDSGRIFSDSTASKLYRIVRDLGDKAGVENSHPHRFRHRFATHLLSKGASLFDVAKLLGDTTSVVEKHYAKWTPGQRDRVRDIMEAG